jgi:hypothetical protein
VVLRATFLRQWNDDAQAALEDMRDCFRHVRGRVRVRIRVSIRGRGRGRGRVRGRARSAL